MRIIFHQELDEYRVKKLIHMFIHVFIQTNCRSSVRSQPIYDL